ncbi:SAM-dependent methyltransferase [Bradyrhizobium macuxiense]|uniref:Nodulation protein S n=1 Tax=Bradyrhizobium macuxiense TaxID=1755647 RepID=A0A109JTN8_9BRAD|nr:nodulation methyltransferase NodS [Bradyrhizobium macuxiense]KWV54674.1 SAM-dependent methyltransferase [Bradyrhizobium macuxiense]
MSLDKTNQLLERELAVDDPWRLDSNPFERERHAQLLRLARSRGAIRNALEVGCAAGAFTTKLAPYCKRLTVVDVAPRAIDRARERMQRFSHITWTVSDISRFSTAERFDLIVVAEVLYYLDDVSRMRAAVCNFVQMLAPEGCLVFGSARDATCQRWGHAAGAETVMAMLNESLVEVERLECHGESVNEDCLLASFINPDRTSNQLNLQH